MASSGEPVASTAPTDAPQEHVASAETSTEQPAQPAQAVEMTQITPPSASEPVLADTAATAESQTIPTAPAEATSAIEAASRPVVLARSETAEFALGPDGAALPTSATDSPEPILRITLMLTTGARHPYLISSKYLTARKVQAVDAAGNFDPREMSAYKLKELIWTDWRPEWEPKPRDPAAIRLIILGRMLEDKNQLKESPFSLTEPNVVHMTVKPADLLDDDPEGATKAIAKSLRGHSNSDDEPAGCCKCVIQ